MNTERTLPLFCLSKLIHSTACPQAPHGIQIWRHTVWVLWNHRQYLRCPKVASCCTTSAHSGEYLAPVSLSLAWRVMQIGCLFNTFSVYDVDCRWLRKWWFDFELWVILDPSEYAIFLELREKKNALIFCCFKWRDISTVSDTVEVTGIGIGERKKRYRNNTTWIPPPLGAAIRSSWRWQLDNTIRTTSCANISDHWRSLLQLEVTAW